MSADLTFLGATETVTGSRTLIEGAGLKILVDCGLYQGAKSDEDRNWEKFPVDPATIDYVILTHAHLDHCGYLPKLVREGFQGKIFSTENTRKLSSIVLRDSAFLQIEDAKYAAKKGYSKHQNPQPLYNNEDVEQTLTLFSDVPYNFSIQLNDRCSFILHRSGHILGSAFVEIKVEGKNLLFSSDMGRPSHPILVSPEPIPAGEFDAMVVESTYGDRAHDAPENLFEEELKAAIARGGTILIPAFAVDRTEVILIALYRLIKRGVIPSLPIYVDSPMALSALKFYREAIDGRSPEIRIDIADQFEREDLFNPGNLREINSVDESKSLNDITQTAIIISASGMATGGRVVHHLANILPNPSNTVMLVGYQAIGSRGQILASGAKMVHIHGEEIPVHATITKVESFSVHADSTELLQWLSTASVSPKKIFVNHGEIDSAKALVEKIHREKGWPAQVPLLEKINFLE